jgi:chromosome partitioning protein
MTTDGPSPVRVVALMNQKGGVGKTTTTVNLAAAFARAGRRTLVVDLDPQAHASLHLGVEVPAGSPTIHGLLLELGSGADAAVRQVGERLWVLPADTDLAGAETELAQASDRQHRLALVLRALEGRFDLVLLDCPPSLGILTVNGLAAAHEVIIPMQAHFLALQGVGKLLETVHLLSRTLNPALRVAGVVLCAHDAGSTHTREVVGDLEAFLEGARGQDCPWRRARVLRPAIRRNIKLAECPSFGKTIFEYAPDAPGAADYEALAAGLVAQWDADDRPASVAEVQVAAASRSVGAPA